MAEGRPRYQVEIPPTLSRYADALRHAGMEPLTLMLDRKIQNAVLGGLERSLSTALQETNPLCQPSANGREEEINTIRMLVEKRIGTAGIGNLIAGVRVIPPKDLFNLSAYDHTNTLVLTDIGRMVLTLKKEWPDLSTFLIAGSARESAGTKPLDLKREKLSARFSQLPSLWREMRRNDSLSLTDSDFLLSAPSGSPSLSQIAQLLATTILTRYKKGWAIVKKSSRRDFERVEFGGAGQQRYNRETDDFTAIPRTSLGHLFYAGFEGRHDPSNLLIPALMENARVGIPILLIPHFHEKENKTMLWGLAVDFFGGYQDVERNESINQKWLTEPSSYAYYPFPEMAFPQRSPQQSLFLLGYYLRTWPWNRLQPIMRSSNRSPLTETLLNAVGNLRRELAKETQEFLTEHAIHFLNKTAEENREQLGTPGQRVEAGISLIEDIMHALDGDSIATMLRLLPAGVCFTNDEKNKHSFETDIYGLGIFDEQGLFPRLGELLHDENNLNRLHSMILRQTTKTIHPEGTDKGVPDRKLLLDFLFEITNNNANAVVKLFQPAWCNDKEWKQVVDSYKERLVAIDQRFNSLSKEQRVLLSERVIEILQQAQRPMSAKEIAEILKASKPDTPAIQHVFATMQRLEEKEEVVVRFGGSRGGGIGTGGHRIWFCHRDFAENFRRDLRFMTPREKILTILENNAGLNIQQLAETSELSKEVVSAAMKLLKQEGIVEYHEFKYHVGGWYLREGET